ncbi:MAG: ribonuclease P protein component [Proteobacteria bacterium]|nr:ribonuclease P protein component [Pseudomonadota bacterium]
MFALVENSIVTLEEKSTVASRSHKLAKTTRLKKKKDFRFSRFERVKTGFFTFVYTREGKGRLGLSLSKKVLKSAVARNRIRRLLREVFRKNLDSFQGIDVNVLGLSSLTTQWKRLGLLEVSEEVNEFIKYIGRPKNIK